MRVRRVPHLAPGALLLSALAKLSPRYLLRNPVMLAVEVGAALLLLETLLRPRAFTLWVDLWLWLTLLFAALAEALAEGRGKAQAQTLRRIRQELVAKRLKAPDPEAPFEAVPASALNPGDLVLVQAGDYIPADGEAVLGIASVDESAVTGESAPVIREAGGDRSGVTAGTRVLSDWLVVRVTARPGESFLDRMIALVEGAKRRKTPNEVALSLLLAAFTLIFLAVVLTLPFFTRYAGGHPELAVLVALFVCLAPTTIGGLLPAIGIAGMDRLLRRNVVALSGRAVEAAGDVDVLLLDKTGTITLGNRQAVAFIPAPGVEESRLARAAYLASLADETPEGRSVVVLAKTRFGLREPLPEGAQVVPFSAETRVSGVDLPGLSLRKGAVEAIARIAGPVPEPLARTVEAIARSGGTPLLVAENGRILGAIHLKDVLKGGIRERFAALRRMGIRTIMVTGDNPLTAKAIAEEAGVDDFLAQATPEAKLRLIQRLQAEGHMVAMAGDGTNDAPALAQADVGLAMNAGTQAAREAANMIDLDSNPTKLLEVVEVGKQLLITRGALTTFSIANDLAKYFAILPAALSPFYPELGRLNLMGLRTPESAILSAVIFNALVIPALVPLALKGVAYRPRPARELFRYNLLVYGLGGLLVPFLGIKLLDLLLGLLWR
ncbi:potassium-transporting ATPase subunit KdpB [Thermus thalpophilus]|uniref:potassium-transporting ATPase subunit KdpB n=1 Tax=Thermus thalpophilus TaxID=2908147 RepID=UPI001FAA9EAE